MYKFPGDYDLKKVELTTFDGSNVLDIRNLVLECHIFESIYQPTITCDIVITDAIGFIEGAPITGQEKVSISIDTPKSSDSKSVGDTFDRDFIVYKISSRGFDTTQGTNIYILHLCTKEFLVGNALAFSSSYRGTPSEICQKLFKDAFQTQDIKLNVEKTLRETLVVFPNTNLFKSINMLSNYSQSEQHNTSTFLLYEDHVNGFNYISVETLLQKKPGDTDKYFFENTPNTPDSSRSSRKNFTIRNLEMIKDFDNLLGLSTGMFSSRTISHDLVTKSYNITKYNYGDDFTASDSIYSNPLIKSKSSNFSYNDDKYCENMTYLISTDLFRKNDEYVKSKKSELDTNHFRAMNEVVGGRVSKLHQIDYMKMKIDIPGDLRLCAGKIINILVPTMSKKTNNSETLDKRLSGKYLISNITHSFSKNQYATKCEVIKDSFETDIKFNDGLK